MVVLANMPLAWWCDETIYVGGLSCCSVCFAFVFVVFCLCVISACWCALKGACNCVLHLLTYICRTLFPNVKGGNSGCNLHVHANWDLWPGRAMYWSLCTLLFRFLISFSWNISRTRTACMIHYKNIVFGLCYRNYFSLIPKKKKKRFLAIWYRVRGCKLCVSKYGINGLFLHLWQCFAVVDTFGPWSWIFSVW